MAEKYSKKSGEISRSSSTTITYDKNVFQLNYLCQGSSPKVGIFYDSVLNNGGGGLGVLNFPKCAFLALKNDFC